MSEALLKSWWIPALRGIVAILFSLLLLAWPGLTVLAFVALFSAFAFLNGVVCIAGALRSRQTDKDWWQLLITGLVGIGAGAIAILHPGLTALVLILLVGANALMTGILDISAAIRLRRVIANEWALGLSGLASVLFGIFIFLFPAAGGLTILWMISLYALVSGGLLLALAFRLRARSRPATGWVEKRVTPDRRMSHAH